MIKYKFVCAEIPNPDGDTLFYEVVQANMIHGLCVILNKKLCLNER